MINKLQDRKQERADFLASHMRTQAKLLFANYLTDMLDIDRAWAAAELMTLLTESVAVACQLLATDSRQWEMFVDRHICHLKEYKDCMNFDGSSYFSGDEE